VVVSRRTGGETDLVEEVAAIRAAGASAVHPVEFDADDTASHPGSAREDRRRARPDRRRVSSRSGSSATRSGAEQDPDHAMAVIHTDFVAAGQRSHRAGASSAGAGQRARLVVFSSVAGVRGPPGQLRVRLGEGRTRRIRRRAGRTPCTAPGPRLLLVRPGFVIGRRNRRHETRPRCQALRIKCTDAGREGPARRTEDRWSGSRGCSAGARTVWRGCCRRRSGVGCPGSRRFLVSAER